MSDSFWVWDSCWKQEVYDENNLKNCLGLCRITQRISQCNPSLQLLQPNTSTQQRCDLLKTLLLVPAAAGQVLSEPYWAMCLQIACCLHMFIGSAGLRIFDVRNKFCWRGRQIRRQRLFHQLRNDASFLVSGVVLIMMKIMML